MSAHCTLQHCCAMFARVLILASSSILLRLDRLIYVRIAARANTQRVDKIIVNFLVLTESNEMYFPMRPCVRICLPTATDLIDSHINILQGALFRQFSQHTKTKPKIHSQKPRIDLQYTHNTLYSHVCLRNRTRNGRLHLGRDCPLLAGTQTHNF